ncbi:hypothetical protein K443DRAFT_86101 [Laccaria amethystina LaAM-08-1]|uniref:Uncharacterized protein n=1 Tax=Laccaria amethystina LaAM-08-1 TaxID=1095629 RepID=A0A0C9X6X7_9AGAR|nr:hypothetical protein K443DRAFT_86101 [Laccaria amethystina LaAM-08-1]
MPGSVVPMAPEIIWFNPSNEYLADPDRMLGSINKTTAAYGMTAAYYGFHTKEQRTGVWVLAWQTLAHHQHFMGEEIYAEAMLPVMEAMVGAGHMTQALLHHRHDLMRALSSPVTQFIYITVRPRHDRGYELVPLIEKVRKELKTVPGCFGSSWGPSVEQDDVQVGVIGWRCIQDCSNAVKGQISSTVKLIHELGHVELKWATLNRHEL